LVGGHPKVEDGLQPHDDDESDDLNAMFHFVLSVVFSVVLTEESVLSDPAHETPRLEPQGDGRGAVGSSAPASSVWLSTKPLPPVNPSPGFPGPSNRCRA
jgi:hypothetical protein